MGSESTTWARTSSRPSSNTANRPTGPAPTISASVSMTSGARCQRTSWSSLPVRSFHSSASGSARLAPRDARPALGQLGVELGHVLLVAGHVFLGNDGVDRALGDADGAVDALVGVDGQEVRAFTEAVDRADVDAVGVLAADARFEDDVGHGANFTVSIALASAAGRRRRACGGIASVAMRVAPTPTVTIVGRPACSTVAWPSVAMRWSLASSSGQPARETTERRRRSPASRRRPGGATARRAACRPCRTIRCRRGGRPRGRRRASSPS